MGKTIADQIRHIKVTPEMLGLAAIMEKLPREEQIIVVVKHKDGKKNVMING